MRKMIASLVGLGIFSSLLVQVSFAQSEVFSDVAADSEFAESIGALRSRSVVEGYSDGTYKPDSKINRAEFLKITVESKKENFPKLAECAEKKISNFRDVPAGEWYAKYVCAAQATNLVKGYADGSFRPERQISFAEAAKIILNSNGYAIADFQGEQWYLNYAQKMVDLKAIPLSIDNKHSEITRGEMAEMIWRITENRTDKPSQTLEEILNSGLSKATETKIEAKATGDFPRLASCEDLSTKVQASFGASKRDFGFEGIEMEDAAEESAVSAPAADLGGGGGSKDFSQTNVQVQGVDEADIIKNDGKFIYALKGDTVRIVRAFPTENLFELSKLSFNDSNFYPSEIYVSGDKLVVVGSSYGQVTIQSSMAESMIMPPSYGSSRTKIYVVDITDRANPKKIRETSLEGNQISSRRIGDHLYLALNKYPEFYYYGGIEPAMIAEGTPSFSDEALGQMAIADEKMAACNEIAYFPGFQNPNYLIIAAVPIADLNQKVAREVILGGGETVYTSPNNMYVVQSDYDFGIEPLPTDPVVDIVDEVDPVREQKAREQSKIFKFALNKGDVAFKAAGTVPGMVLNQFSMDEYAGNFRIATTQGNLWDEKNPASNNVYVLDEKLNISGKIENIAPNEKIYSVRFMGKRGYMVTFRNVDPLFAFDLSDPKNPRILGQLKIPGYSDYLHPYDENHLIGFGKDAMEVKNDPFNNNFAWYQGMKIALFDVSDPTAPKQKFVEMIGDRGTHSDLLYNHKALLFDKERKLLAFPVSVAQLTEEQKKTEDASAWGQTVFQGAYVYELDLTSGFKLKGKISHYDQNAEEFLKSGDFFYGNYDLNINRIIYIGEYLYTISEGMIKAFGFTDLKEKNSIELKK
jgi:uncharacterized secreted protein with C-terminal beta-propeller domain